MASSDLEAALASVAEGESEAAADEQEEETETKAEATADADEEVEDSESKAKGKGATDRIRTLSGKVKELSEQLGETNDKLTARDQEIEKLVDLLEMREKDSRVIQKINELYEEGPEDIKASIQKLNNAIMGVETTLEEAEEQAEEAKEAGDSDALKQIQKLTKELEATKSALEDRLEDQNDSLILDKADGMVEKLFAQLGDEYTEEDRKVMSSVVVDRINWEAVEEDPASLAKEVAKGFEDTKEWYGTPRGALANQSKSETKDEPEVPTLDKIKSVDWAKTKTVKDAKGKENTVPEYNDATFTEALAEALRQSR